MNYGTNALALAEAFETFVPFTYDDARFPPIPARADVGVLGTLTIGFGETGPHAYFGNRCSEDQAIAWLTARLAAAAAIVTRDAGAIVLTQNQFDALTDFVFNCGVENFEDSTLLKDLLAHDLADIPGQLQRFDHIGMRVRPGLGRRREAEITLWNTPDGSASSPSEALARNAGEGGAQAPGEGAEDSSADELNTAELKTLGATPA